MNQHNNCELPPIIILAGGLGTRLKSLTAARPKAMVEVLGEPFIAHQLSLLSKNGANKIVLSVKHFADQIEEFVGDGAKWNLSVTYSNDGNLLLGTGGAVLKASPDFSEFGVLYGDSYLDIDYRSVYSSFLTSQKSGLMTVFENKNNFVPSNVWMENETIKAYGKENPSPLMAHVDYGLSFFKANAFESFKKSSATEEAPFDLGEVTRKLLSDKQLATAEVFQRFYEVGSVEGIKDLENYLSSKQ